jgi:hypothetical protein
MKKSANNDKKQVKARETAIQEPAKAATDATEHGMDFSDEMDKSKPTTIQQENIAGDDPGPDWSKIDRIDRNSLDARWEFEKWSVIRELWRANYQMVTYLMKPEGGGHSLEEAIRQASTELGEGVMLEKQMGSIIGRNVDSITWYTLDKVFRTKPSYAQQIWEEVKEQALKDFKSGHFAAEMFERTNWQKDVWKRAHFVVIYEEMIEAYKPRDAIEQSMVEMVAVHFFLWRHWVTEHLLRSTTEPRRESHDYKEWVKSNTEVTTYFARERHTRNRQRHWTDGYWDIPYQHEADAIQHAIEIADRCRRAYHASIRALRDWRRYNAPLIVQNAEQINIAADGGQQVNLQKKKPYKKRKEASGRASKGKRSSKRATRSKPKQLSSKSTEES